MADLPKQGLSHTLSVGLPFSFYQTVLHLALQYPILLISYYLYCSHKQLSTNYNISCSLGKIIKQDFNVCLHTLFCLSLFLTSLLFRLPSVKSLSLVAALFHTDPCHHGCNH